jgi:hypothetical protein
MIASLPQMDPSPLSLSVSVERWPIAGAFTISRGAKTEAVVVVAELTDGMHRGRGECVPYARYGETVEGVAAAIEELAGTIAQGLDRERLQSAMAPGAAATRSTALRGPTGRRCRWYKPRASRAEAATTTRSRSRAGCDGAGRQLPDRRRSRPSRRSGRSRAEFFGRCNA